MIVAAALCPGPPLLIRELSGADPAAAVLRDACHAAVATLVATAPDLVAVVGTADRASTMAGRRATRSGLVRRCHCPTPRRWHR